MKRDNERIVFSGTRLRVYQRDQELFDGTSKVFERAQRMSPAYILPVQEWKILLAYQKQPHKEDRYRSHVWWLIERWEDIYDWAKRELLEETWFESARFEQYRKYSGRWLVWVDKYVFIAKDLKKVAEQNLDTGSEIIELKWVTIETYIDMLIHRQCWWGSGWREEIMLKMIDWWIEDFKKLLLQ